MRSWVSFYKGRVFSEDYLSYAAKRYRPFLNEIEGRKRPGDRIAEVGCGIATITKLLSTHDNISGMSCVYSCYDINPDMVELAQANLGHSYVGVADARWSMPCHPDIIHSHGLLEHFSDGDIQKIIDAGFISGCRCQVHYVPGDKYKEPSFGDERLLPADYWIDNFKPQWAFSFNDGHDYCLIWE